MATQQPERAPHGALFSGSSGPAQRAVSSRLSHRIPPELRVRRSRAFRFHDAIQNPYSIDHLPELPGLHRRFLSLAGQVLNDIIRLKFRQSAARKRCDKPFRPHCVPACRRWLNSLRNRPMPVPFPESALPFATTSCRHEPTSLFIHDPTMGILPEGARPAQGTVLRASGAMQILYITDITDSV